MNDTKFLTSQTPQKSRFHSFIRNRFFLGSLLILGFAYSTILCFLHNPLAEEYTVSMVGVRYPALFIIWHVLTGTAYFFNNRAMYETYCYPNALGRALTWAALCAQPVIFLINGSLIDGEVIYLGISRPIHWTASIFFIVCNAAAMGFLFLYARKQLRKFNILLVSILLIVAGMLITILTVGKSALFEAIPSWATYIMLFLVNCTKFFAPNSPDAGSDQGSQTAQSDLLKAASKQ